MALAGSNFRAVAQDFQSEQWRRQALSKSIYVKAQITEASDLEYGQGVERLKSRKLFNRFRL